MPPLPNNGANNLPSATPAPAGQAPGNAVPAWATLDPEQRVEAIFSDTNLSPRQAAQQLNQLKQQASGHPAGVAGDQARV